MHAIDREPTVTAMPATGATADYAALFGAAYSVLRGVARAQRARWCGAATLCTTALVHEAYLRLSPGDSPQWQDRGHFFRVASRAMRHILIDYAERRRAIKRGGGGVALSIDEAPLVDESRIEDLLALDEALTQLERHSPRQAQVVECRVFAGLDVVETAQALAISATTVKREWRRGQAWLYRRLQSPAQVGMDVRNAHEMA
ncbi:MAG TPA: ECF-type sigma factor [Dokdonella sp.]